MKSKYVVFDPGSHEHLRKFNPKKPGKSRWVYLDTDIHSDGKAQLFDTAIEARLAAVNIVKSEQEESLQLEVREVKPAFVETGKYFSRVE